MPVRVVFTWRLDASLPLPELERQIQDAPFVTGSGDDWLQYGTFKVTLDGGMTIGTAYQRQPYGPFGRQLYGQTDAASHQEVKGVRCWFWEAVAERPQHGHTRAWQSCFQ